ncbi:hypothetical protein ACJMK2_042401 [Sinanodonta woodiana]|uniref:MutS protein homolog 5 n=1 Tax=Sinanodonta woodiana TaxID=1069815 RepID=A0ABD3W798_SINWO
MGKQQTCNPRVLLLKPNQVSQVLKQVGPSQVILSTKQEERLVKRIKGFCGFSENNAGNGRLQFLPSIDLSLEMCKRRILSLDLPSIPSHYTVTERTLYISSLVPFENACMVRAVGGLIKYLERKRIGVQLEEQSVRVPILELKIFSLENQLIMDDTAFSALQIFQKEFHPSAYKVGTSSSVREGLSLFGILNRCKCQNGSKLLRLWFLRPSRDQTVLKQRFDAISFFVNPINIEVVSSLQDNLKNIKNVSRILMRMTQSQASFGDWQVLYKTAYHAIYIGDICRAQPQNIEIFRKISVAFSDRLHSLAAFISQVVDFEGSSLQRRFVVKPNVDAELDEKKRTYAGLPDFMTQVARKELEKLSENITECIVLYLPQLGYLLAIPKPEGQMLENYEIEGLTFMFLSNNMLHYKSASTRELDAIFGDIQCDIIDMETTIMHKLQNKILEESQVLMAVMDYTAELDCLLALAACTREFGYVRPSLTDENVIEIKGGRHPLQELCCSPFVPNGTVSNSSYGKIKVLTGPNASGKSVYLKQVALIVYMTHIGCFVPAESAKIGPIDQIFTRIHSLESVSVGLSTFMIDINQMAAALQNATERSLVVVDEFGKGTDMVDGLALLSSSLAYWLGMDRHPHVFISTHFHSLIHQHLLPSSPYLKYMTLESLHSGEELVFLYQLVEGYTSSSYASHIAALAGLPKEIVQRGSAVSDMIRQNKPVHRIDSESTDAQYKRCLMIVSEFLEVDLETADLQAFLKNTVLSMSKEKL